MKKDKSFNKQREEFYKKQLLREASHWLGQSLVTMRTGHVQE